MGVLEAEADVLVDDFVVVLISGGGAVARFSGVVCRH